LHRTGRIESRDVRGGLPGTIDSQRHHAGIGFVGDRQ
jgi:hypothetical protein